MKRLFLWGSMVFVLSGCQIDLLHDIDEAQANEILARLQEYGIAAKKMRVTAGNQVSYALSVARGDAATAWQVLRQDNLPRPRRSGLGDVFGKVGLVPTATQERALLRHAIAGELERSLLSIDGVRQARVHVVIPERRPFARDDETGQTRAAVLLTVTDPSPVSETQVQELVAGSVEGLLAADVRVVIAAIDPAADQARRAIAAITAVGPFRVARESRGALIATMIVGVLLIVSLALALLTLWRKLRTLSQSVAQLSAPAASPSLGDADASLGLIAQSLSRSQHYTTRE